MRPVLLATLIAASVLAGGCKEDKKDGGSLQVTRGGDTSAATKPVETPHNRIPIGETTVGDLKLVATMDEPVKPGGEGAFDLVITGGKPKAVRFWVGTEAAEGSVKAKAEEETTDNWHAHTEVPNPLPAGSRFWAEIELPTGQPFKVPFDLRRAD
jgi:hypothetical protein